MADLVATDICKEFPTRDEPLQILKGISLQLDSGDNLAIVGPSGSGKSTLLHVIGTLDHPTSGSITLEGKDPFALGETELCQFRNDRVGFVFQDHHLLPQLNAIENVLIPTLAHGKSSNAAIQRGKSLLGEVGLSDRLHHKPAELSGGEKQRVAIARALINEPKLLLADEPTGNLDRTNAQAITDLLLRLQRESNSMLIVVTHSKDLADQMQSCVEIDDGILKS